MVTFDEERRRQLMRISMRLAAALEAGDLEAGRAALEDDDDWPDAVDPYLHSTVLSIALGRADLDTIRRLLDQGADPNFRAVDDGFPCLIDVLHHRCRDAPGLPHWDDCHDVLRALIDAGAEVDERGLNDWTALHFAAAADDVVAVRMLLEAGADPEARTRIDDLETPIDVARTGSPEVLATLTQWLAR
jgi:ankyrin repeat protein